MTFGKRCLYALVLLGARAAYAAGPSPTDVATARELYKQGSEALEKNDASAAVQKLTQAWALVQTPVIGADLARAHLALGHLVEAREAALAVARLELAPDEKARSADARGQAQKLASSIDARIPHIKISIVGVDPDDAIVKLDGNVVPRAALSAPRQANPGAHVATVETKDGRRAEGSITLAEGATKELELKVPEVATTTQAVEETPKTTPAPPPAIETPPATTRTTSPLLWVGLATAGVGFGVGAITGGFALSEASAVKSGCTKMVGDMFVCSKDDSGHLASANTFATISTIGFITVGVGMAVAIVGFLMSGTKTQKQAVVVPIFGMTNGIAGRF